MDFPYNGICYYYYCHFYYFYYYLSIVSSIQSINLVTDREGRFGEKGKVGWENGHTDRQVGEGRTGSGVGWQETQHNAQ